MFVLVLVRHLHVEVTMLELPEVISTGSAEVDNKPVADETIKFELAFKSAKIKEKGRNEEMMLAHKSKCHVYTST